MKANDINVLIKDESGVEKAVYWGKNKITAHSLVSYLDGELVVLDCAIGEQAERLGESDNFI